ncbi:hypothetical protein DPMN_080320 [Dreissena polymorpha]|uniref:Uncharacterized protein n=1 Tax=Dreissena polymorpha TaxID=45954 RepID=A0A9D3YR62_DREPO|nr:hypothetical protein DPMN_080320 [Dreissena polymorpha]
MAKKIRRQSAPAVGVGQRRRPSTDCHKLTPVSGETIDTDEIKVSENNEHDSESTDDEDVFEISLELVQPSKHKSIEILRPILTDWPGWIVSFPQKSKQSQCQYQEKQKCQKTYCTLLSVITGQ